MDVVDTLFLVVLWGGVSVLVGLLFYQLHALALDCWRAYGWTFAGTAPLGFMIWIDLLIILGLVMHG